MPDLQAFAKDVWIADGPRVRDFGVMFTTRMEVVKLSNGLLWVNSPVVVPFDTLQRITQLGPVRYLVAATPRHVWRLEMWHTLFPEAELWAPRSTPFTLKKEYLPLTGILGTGHHRAGRTTLISWCSKATRSSKKFSSFKESLAPSSWMI